MAARLAEALAALLLEHAQLRTARFAVDDAEDLGVGDKRSARQDISRVFLDQQHLFEVEFRPGLTGRSIDLDDSAGRNLDLTAAGLNNRVHERYLSDWLCRGALAPPLGSGTA